MGSLQSQLSAIMQARLRVIKTAKAFPILLNFFRFNMINLINLTIYCCLRYKDTVDSLKDMESESVGKEALQSTLDFFRSSLEFRRFS